MTPTTAAPTSSPSISPTPYPSPLSASITSTIAGTGTAGYSGDNGAATSATIDVPTGIAIDASGNVYFNEYSNHLIRKVTASTGIITTVAGNSSSGYGGDGGPAARALLFHPNGLCIDSSGNVYTSDNNNHRIRKVAVGTTIISTIAGTGSGSYSGDYGPATSAALYNPTGVAIDAAGTHLNISQYSYDSD